MYKNARKTEKKCRQKYKISEDLFLKYKMS